VTVLAGVALGAPAAIRRSRPLTATAVVLTAAVLCLATGVIPDFAAAAPIVAAGLVLYTVGASLPRRRSSAVAVFAVVVFVAALLLAADTPFAPGAGQATAFAALVLGSCWALGWTVRERRAYAAQLSRQATSRAVDEERLRIAREMHDIVAHSMSLIAVKATVANHVADERPQEVRDALRVIEATSRTALTELRRTLGALRTGPDPDLAPAPGVADLPTLVDAATAAGLEVHLDVRGVTDLPEGLGLAVFRIVQEALTNVVKHAEATHCRVTVAGEPGAMVIEVVDDGRGGTEVGGRGQGLIGMRERVALYGGEVRAGPEPGGGWAVRARLDTLA
jgi:signal transduction histidine kinase